MVTRSVSQRARTISDNYQRKFAEEYFDEAVKGDIKKAVYWVREDLKEMEQRYGSNMMTKVRKELIEQLDRELDFLKEQNPLFYVSIYPRVQSLKKSLKNTYKTPESNQ